MASGQMTAALHVARISIAPVKGLQLVHPPEVVLERHGARGDRVFHLADARNRLVSLKRAPGLQFVRAAWDPDTGVLRLDFPDGTVVEDEVVLGEGAMTIFYSRPVTGRLVEGAFSAALSDFCGEPVRLVRPDRGTAADRGRGGGVTLLGHAALAPLGEAAGAELDPRRFRMLLGIEGGEPHAEDGWLHRRVGIGEAVVVPRGHVGRCLVTSRNPDTGVADVDTLDALRRTRSEADTTEPLAFGVFGEVAVPGTVRVGDPVVVEA
jgi:uncharacterized protein YcbX